MNKSAEINELAAALSQFQGAVVDASKDALLSYIASLNVLPPDSKKLCLASINSFLKLVHMKLPEKAML